MAEVFSSLSFFQKVLRHFMFSAIPFPVASPPGLALFDLDGTLLPLDTNQAFGNFLAKLGWVQAEKWAAQNAVFLDDHDKGKLDLNEYIDFVTEAWRHRPLREVSAARDAFVSMVIAPAIPKSSRQLVESHRARGDTLVLVTGTNEFLAEPIAREFGIEHVLAVRLERDASGAVTGKIQGTPSFAQGKVQRVNELLEALNTSLDSFERVSFYGDSVNDIPLLEVATHPVVVNPSESLRKVANSSGWEVLHLHL